MTRAPATGHRHSGHSGKKIRRILHGLALVVCPPDIEDLGIEEAVVDHAEQTVGALPSIVRQGLVAGLHAYDVGALVRHGKHSYALDRERAGRYFAAWNHGPLALHELAKGIKGILCLAYYEMPCVQEAMDYRPQAWVEMTRRRRFEAYEQAIRSHAAQLCEPDPLPDSLLARLPRRRMSDREEP